MISLARSIDADSVPVRVRVRVRVKVRGSHIVIGSGIGSSIGSGTGNVIGGGSVSGCVCLGKLVFALAHWTAGTISTNVLRTHIGPSFIESTWS